MYKDSIIQQLKELGCVLIGSRMMGFNTPNSDYDFMADYSEKTIDGLIKLGFQSTTEEYYDNIFDDFYRLVLNDGTKIEVQCFESPKIIIAVYETYKDLAECKFLKYTQKPYRKMIFLYQLHKNMLEYAPMYKDKLEIVRDAIYEYQDYGRQELNKLYDEQLKVEESLFKFL